MLSEYISSLPKEGKLSREEEARLWDAYKNEGELEARQKLIEHYQLLVFKEATKYPVQNRAFGFDSGRDSRAYGSR